MHYRFATPNDAKVLLDIYSQYIDTPITFECSLPTVEEFRIRIQTISNFYPYLVAEDNGRIFGYVYAHRHMQREAYQWNAELSIYLDSKHTSQGIGTALGQKIINLLKLQGLLKLNSGITQPNLRSVGLHKKLGFKLVGTYINAGFKNGKWYDVSWYQNDIAEHTDSPASPISIRSLPLETVRRILG